MIEFAKMKRSPAAILGIALLVMLPLSQARAEPAGHNGNENSEEKKIIHPGFLTLPPLSIPLVKKYQVAGTLNLEIVLDATTANAMLSATQKQSLLLAGYSTALGKWATSFQDPKAPANVIAIKQQLQHVTEGLLGDAETRVLLQSATLRRRS